MYDSCLSSSDETIQNLSIAIQVMRHTNITVDIIIITYLIGFLAIHHSFLFTRITSYNFQMHIMFYGYTYFRFSPIVMKKIHHKVVQTFFHAL